MWHIKEANKEKSVSGETEEGKYRILAATCLQERQRGWGTENKTEHRESGGLTEVKGSEAAELVVDWGVEGEEVGIRRHPKKVGQIKISVQSHEDLTIWDCSGHTSLSSSLHWSQQCYKRSRPGKEVSGLAVPVSQDAFPRECQMGFRI